MKVTFTQRAMCQATGWSWYNPGDQADLPDGAQLIEAGVAIAGWDSFELQQLTLAELRELAAARNVPNARRLKKAELLDAMQ